MTGMRANAARACLGLLGVACVLSLGAVPVAAITVSLPEFTSPPGAAIAVPVTVADDLTGLDYYGFEGSVHWDASVVNLVNPCVDLSAGLAAGWQVAYNREVTGQLHFVCFGTSPLAGSGPLLSLCFQAVGSPGESTTLQLEAFRFNEEGSPVLEDGEITIAMPSTVTVSLPELSGVAPGSTLCVPISCGDLTGEGVLSFEAEISWDPNTLKLVDPYFDLAGSLPGTDGWSRVMNGSEQGRVRVGAYGTAALAGFGELGCLQFYVRGAAGSWSALRFAAFRFNEGFPEAATSDGRLETPGQGCLRVSVPACSTVIHQPVEVEVLIEDSTTGLEIYSFETRITWDPLLVDHDPSLPPVEIDSIAGPLDSHWVLTVDNITSGELGVVGYDAFGSYPMEGQGTVFRFYLRAGPQAGATPVTFDYTFLLNEGVPCTTPTNGSIVVPVRRMSWGGIKAIYRE